MSGSGWTWYDAINKARALEEGDRYTLATYEKVSGVVKGGHKVRQFGFYVDGVKYILQRHIPSSWVPAILCAS